MSKINVTFHPSDGGVFSEELQKLQKKVGLNTAQIGRAVAELLGTDPKTEGAIYGFCRRGLRRIPDSRLPALAMVLEVKQVELHRINALYEGGACLEFDTQLPFYSYFNSFISGAAKPETKTLGEFLIWLSTEVERDRLKRKVSLGNTPNLSPQ